MKKYLINQDIHKMTDEIYLQISEEDGNTSKTVNRLPDDESYTYDIFIPREYCINPFPLKWPKSKKTRILVGAIDSPFYNQYREKGELINFDTFWLYESAREIRVENYNSTKREQKYLFTTMINRSKWHRRTLMKVLDDFGLLYDKSAYSFLHPVSHEERDVIWHGEFEQKLLPSQEWIKENYQHDQPSFEWDIPIELKQSLFQIVPETGWSNTDPTFVTEKTWIPLLLGIPFVVVGNKGFHKDLHERFGIEPYDELFDYKFDEVEDLEERIYELVKSINKLKKTEPWGSNKVWDYLNEKVQQKARRNQNRVHEMILNSDGVPNITSSQSSEWDWIVESAQKRIHSGGFLEKNII
jgi:hypothetical protein